MSLLESMKRIQTRIISQQELMTNENAAISLSVLPFIRALGYDNYCLEEVFPEYRADSRTKGNERVDYAIMKDGAPIILVECKQAKAKLNENHWRQLHDYFNSIEAQFAILTNGLEYRFYSDYIKPNVMDKEPFFRFNFLDWTSECIRVIESFTKDNFDPTATKRRMKMLHCIQSEFASPSDELVKTFIKLAGAGKATRKAVDTYRSIIQETFEEVIDQEIINRVTRANP